MFYKELLHQDQVEPEFSNPIRKGVLLETELERIHMMEHNLESLELEEEKELELLPVESLPAPRADQEEIHP